MIEWRDNGIVLSQRPFGEDAALVQVLTEDHGRCAGLVRGATSRRRRWVTEPGNRVAVTWRARLADQLGRFECEAEASPAANWLDDRVRLAAIAAACAVAETALPEREPHPGAFAGLAALFDLLDHEIWPAAYVRWEVGLLAELGYGLDLERCALGGDASGLAWVSPRSGRAVSEEKCEPWRERLLPLPGFLVGRGEVDPESVLAGLDLTAHFLARHVLAPADRGLPAARERLRDVFEAANRA